jgi:hypothetical protein
MMVMSTLLMISNMNTLPILLLYVIKTVMDLSMLMKFSNVLTIMKMTGDLKTVHVWEISNVKTQSQLPLNVPVFGLVNKLMMPLLLG